MKRLISSIIVMSMLIGFSGCSNNPEDTLQESINNYKECMIENDYTCQAKYLDPSNSNPTPKITTQSFLQH